MKNINNYIDESLTKSYDSNILIKKLKNKYKDYIDRPIIIHTKDLKIENDILYLPIYMTCLL